MLSKFDDFSFLSRKGGGGGGGGKLFTLDQKWNWKLHISSLSRKLGHRLAVFHRILHVLDK